MSLASHLKSMTGFGESGFSLGGSGYRVQISSVNHRFLEISMKIPDEFAMLESRIKNSVRRRVARGRVFILIKREGGGSSCPEINPEVARKYVKDLRKLSRELGITEEVSLQMIAELPGVFQGRELSEDAETAWKPLKKGVNSALKNFLLARAAEGKNLGMDILKSLDSLAKHIAAVKKRAETVSKKKRREFNLRVKEAGIDPLEGNIASEIVNMLNRLDINEELIRFDSHVEQFREAFLKKPSGVRFEFILQEMLREVNTIGSKSQDSAVTKRVVEIKTELQKMREQVQNVE